MRTKERIYMDFARILPKPYREHFKKQLDYAGLKDANENTLLGATTLLSLLVIGISAAAAYSLRLDFAWWHVAAGVGLAALSQLILYFTIYFRAMDRSKRAEEALPDLLHLLASNLRAGMTPYNALKSSQRKEFGPLAEELAHATQMAMGNEGFNVILLRIGQHINSTLLDRTLRLFSTSVRSGGNSATLLEDLAQDIVETRQLKKEFISSTKTYSMFIFFTVVLGAPFLLTVAMQFVKMITDIAGKTNLSAGSSMGMGFFSGKMVVTTDFLFTLSICMLVVTGLLASALMGTIREGKPKDGLRMAPVIIGASIIMFFISQMMIGKFF